MKGILFFLTAPLSLALAKAPLLSQDSKDTIPHNYVVVLKSHLTSTKAKSYYETMRASSKSLAKAGHRGLVRTFENIGGMHAFHIECDTEMLDSIRKASSVDYVAQDERISHLAAARGITARDDQVASYNWGLGRISHRDPGITKYVSAAPLRTRLYVTDTGISITHDQFGGRAVWGANFVDGSPDTDENGHGTHTAATAAGNTVGVDNSTIPVAVKCLDKNSSGTWSGVLAAMDWSVGDAITRKIITRSVINMSIGGTTFQPINDMVAKAVAAGMTVVVAASNYGADASGYSPAGSPQAITVGAIDRNDTRPSWSNWGSAVDIFAPGTDIVSAWLGTDSSYATLSGTSMASPHVAGLATYLMSREGISGPTDVRGRIVELATPNLVQASNGSTNLIAYNGADSNS